MKTIVHKIFSVGVTVLVLLMVAMVFTNAVLRYGFKSGIPEAEELSRYLFVWICFMGTIYAFKDNSHVGVTMFLDMMPAKIRPWMMGFGELVTFFVLIIMFWGGVSYIQTGGASIGPSTGIMMGFISVSICVASLAMMGIMVQRMVRKYWPSRKAEG